MVSVTLRPIFGSVQRKERVLLRNCILPFVPKVVFCHGIYIWDWLTGRIYADREGVNKFYEAALAAGGKCNGRPGIREIYHPNYYGAVRIHLPRGAYYGGPILTNGKCDQFVIDPVGNNIEAVCHNKEE